MTSLSPVTLDTLKISKPVPENVTQNLFTSLLVDRKTTYPSFKDFLELLRQHIFHFFK